MQLEDELQAKLTELLSLKKSSQKAASEIQILKKNISSTLTEIEKCNKTVESTQGNILSETAKNKTAVNKLLATHKSLTETVQSQKKTLAGLEAAKVQLDKKIADMGKDISQYRTSFVDFEKKIQGHVLSKRVVLVEISKVEKELGELRKQMSLANQSGSRQVQLLNAERTKLEAQLSSLNNRLASTTSENKSVVESITRLEEESRKLKAYVQEITNKLSASSNSDATLKGDIEKLQKQRQQLAKEAEELENLIKQNTVREESKSKAASLLEEQKKFLEKELGDLQALNSNISSRLKSLKEQSAKNQKEFQTKLSSQNQSNQQVIASLEQRFQQNVKKINAVQSQLDNFSKLEAQLRSRIAELTKRSKALGAEKTDAEGKIKDVSSQVQKTNAIILELQREVSKLSSQLLKYNEGVFRQLPGVKFIGKDVMQAWKGNDVNECYRRCAESAQCIGFTRQGDTCFFKGSNASDGVDYKTTMSSYLKHSMDEESIIKRLQIVEQKVKKCDEDMQQVMLGFHVNRPVALKFEGRDLCALKGLIVRGWYVKDGKCLQKCPDTEQDRHGDGRCKCGDVEQNRYCPDHTTCVKTSNEPGSCEGTKFGVPDAPNPTGELALPGSARCPDYWFIIKNDAVFRRKYGNFDTSYDYFWGRCRPNPQANQPKNPRCNKVMEFVNDNWYTTRPKWAKDCGVTWSAFDVQN